MTKSIVQTNRRLSAIYQPRPGELPFKEWVANRMEQFGISYTAVWMRIERGKLLLPPVRRVNSRVLFVKP